MEISLTQTQLEALAFFIEYNYLIVQAPRRSGKTVLLQELIRQYPERKIGVYCLSKVFFDREYKHFKNCTFMQEGMTDKRLDMIIGDEYYLTPQKKPTACALSPRHIILRWNTTNSILSGNKRLNTLKKEMTREVYELEFGQYDQEETKSEPHAKGSLE